MAIIQKLLTVVELQPLTLSATAFQAGDPQGTVVGTIFGASPGSTIAFNSLSTAGALQIVGTSLQVGPTPSSTPATITFNRVETLVGATNTLNQTNSLSVSELVAIPVNTVVPTISGTAQVGQTLTATTGTWTHSPTSFTYQWNRAGTAISGATAASYVPVTGDIGNTPTVSVVATNASGSSSPATSAPTVAVIDIIPANSSVPTISGTAQVGQTLTATTGTWTHNPTSFTYQWNRAGTAISGATAASYVPVTGDIGNTLTVSAYALARTLAHNNLNDFLPDFLRQSGRAAEHGQPAGVASRTFESVTPKVRLPASQARRTEAPGGRLPAAGAASTMAALLDPSRLAAPAETGIPSDGSAPFGKLSPATRGIAGSDAVVAGTIRPDNMASISPLPRPPVATVPAKALPSADLAAAPPVPSAGPLTALAAPPAVGPSKNLLRKAEAGDAAAQFDLAVRYAEGGAGPRNFELAAQWYEKAAQQGLAVAEYRLGSLYEKGLGVGKDMQRAKDLYQRAAAEGGKPNYTSAALWLGQAAEYGIRDSQYNLAVLLGRGLGLPKDLVKSYTWCAIVAATGDADAARKRDDVAARLTSSELAAANAAAAGFAPRPADRAANEITPPRAQMEADPAQGQPVKPKVSGL
ncbi:MAG: hypothetical protein ACR2KT_10230 [Methylocella sp.]